MRQVSYCTTVAWEWSVQQFISVKFRDPRTVLGEKTEEQIWRNRSLFLMKLKQCRSVLLHIVMANKLVRSLAHDPWREKSTY